MAIPINSMSDLRIHLREERIRQGIDQDQIPGLGRTTVLSFENGKGDVTMNTVMTMLSALGGRLELDFDAPSRDVLPRDLDIHVGLASDDDIDLPEPGQ